MFLPVLAVLWASLDGNYVERSAGGQCDVALLVSGAEQSAQGRRALAGYITTIWCISQHGRSAVISMTIKVKDA
ncbi:MAG: hypothetical protein JO141_33630 [Bradyrhizobium sp.]|nr:hypothetical protein [Bradyrhizobium sp.]